MGGDPPIYWENIACFEAVLPMGAFKPVSCTQCGGEEAFGELFSVLLL